MGRAIASLTPALVLALATFNAAGASAQSLEDRLRSQLVATVTQLRALQDSQAALAAKAARADADDKAIADLKGQLAAAQARLRVAERRPVAPRIVAAPAPDLDRYKAQVAQAEQADAQSKAQVVAAQQANAQLSDRADRLQAEHDALAATVAASQASLATCQAKSAYAITVAKAILVAYDRVSIADVAARKEPFTRIARVRLQQAEQDFQDRLYDSRLDAKPRPQPSKPAPAPAKPQGPAQ